MNPITLTEEDFSTLEDLRNRVEAISEICGGGEYQHVHTFLRPISKTLTDLFNDLDIRQMNQRPGRAGATDDGGVE